MPQPKNIQTILNNVKYISRPIEIISQLFNHYKGREYSLIQLLYKKGVTQAEIAKTLQVDPAVISRNYPKGDIK